MPFVLHVFFTYWTGGLLGLFYTKIGHLSAVNYKLWSGTELKRKNILYDLSIYYSHL